MINTFQRLQSIGSFVTIKTLFCMATSPIVNNDLPESLSLFLDVEKKMVTFSVFKLLTARLGLT